MEECNVHVLDQSRAHDLQGCIPVYTCTDYTSISYTQFIIVSKNLLVPYISKIYVLPGHFTDWFLKLKDL